MRSIQTLTLLLLMSLCLVCGCGRTLQSKITGKWEIDSSNGLFEMMGDEGEASKPRFELEFQRGGVFRSTVTSSGHTQSKEGRWFFVEGAADVCKLRVSINSDNPDIEPDIVLTEVKLIDENSIELVPPNMDVIKEKMTFRRAK